MGSPSYFPTGYFGGEGDGGGVTPASTGGKRFQFVELYASRLDYELGTNDSAVLFTTARRKASVNEGLREFADLTECWIRESTITCSNAVASYSLMSANLPGQDFVRLTPDGPEYEYHDVSSNVTYLHGDELPRRDIPWLNAHESGWKASTGATYPSCYYLDNEAGNLTINLYPPPTIVSSAAGSIRLPYVAKPSSLVDDTSVPFTDSTGYTRTDLQPYHQALVHFAAHRLELLRKDTEASDRQMQKFLGYVQRFIQQKRTKGGGQIRPARSYFSRAGDRATDDLSGLRAPWWR
jgi:hypothetical protein